MRPSIVIVLGVAAVWTSLTSAWAGEPGGGPALRAFDKPKPVSSFDLWDDRAIGTESTQDGIAPGGCYDPQKMRSGCGRWSRSCAASGCCTCLCNVWVDVDYLLWWTDGQNLPPLVTTSPAGTPRAEAGVSGFDDTTTLFGGGRDGTDEQSGGRLSVGKWLDGCHLMGIEGRFWSIGGNSSDFEATSEQYPILARPFFNTQLGQQDSSLVAFPGELQGSLEAGVETDVLAAEANVRVLLTRGPTGRLDFIGGYHYTRVDHGLVVSSLATSIDPGGTVPVGTTFDVVDSFQAENEFNGGQFGLLATIQDGCWTISALAKVSLGNMSETVLIDGSTTTSVPAGGTSTTVGGLLTQPTNIGMYQQDSFATVPEVNVRLGYCLTERVDFTVGYSFIYWTRMAAAADSIDRSVNRSQLGGQPLLGEARPTFRFQETDFWAQGLSFGLHGRF